MKIYTRTGDGGETSLFNGTRVPKHDAHIEALGSVDETNAHIGVALSLLRLEWSKLQALEGSDAERSKRVGYVVKQLEYISNQLFDIGACIATPRTSSNESRVSKTPFNTAGELALERFIDEHDEKLAPLTSFILPSGHPIAAHLHVSRTVCRRAERDTTHLLSSGDVPVEVLRFLNRLSDYLFTCSRAINQIFGCEEPTWQKAMAPPTAPLS